MRLALAILFASLVSAHAAFQVDTDNLSLGFSSVGQVTNVTLGGSALPIVGTGGFEIADYGASTNFTLISGSMATITGGVSFTGTTNNVLLTATITTNASNIFISGTLTNQHSTNRAIALRFGLPIDMPGWTWYDDIATTRTVSSAITYQNVLATEAGSGLRSLYPLGTLSDGINSLTMATPIAPTVAQIGYDHAAKAFFATLYVSLSTNTTKNSNSAPFSFTLYRTYQNGFRAALAQYYATYPGSFIKRNTFESNFGYGFQNEEFVYSTHYVTNAGSNYPLPDASDFGEGFDSIRSLHGVAYATTWATNSAAQPSDSLFRSWLSVQPAGSLYPGSDAVQQLFVDSTGAIRYAATNYDSGAHVWSIEAYVNQDPDITSGLTSQITGDLATYYGSYRLQWKPAIPSDFADGGFGSVHLDYDTNHVNSMDFAPTFGASSLLPGIVSGLWDFDHDYLYPRSTTNSFTLIGNTGDPDYLYSAPWLDIGMSEGSRTLSEYRFYRTLSYHKIFRNYTTIGTSGTNVYTLPDFLSELQNCLALAIYPSLGATTVGHMTESFRPYYRLYLPAIEEESRSGWEPITYATADNGALVERFGSFAGNSLVFSVSNTNAAPVTSTVTLDVSGLGASGATQWCAQDLISLAYLPVTAGTLSIALTNGQTRAISCVDTNGVWQRKITMAQAYLGRLQRTFTNDLVSADNLRIDALRSSLAAVDSNSALSASESTLNAQITDVQSGIATPSQTDLSKLIARIRDAVSAPSSIGITSVRISGTVRLGGLVRMQ